MLEGVDATDWARIRQFVIEVQDLDGRLSEVLRLLDEHGFAAHAERPENLPEEFRYHMVYACRT